MKRKVAIFILKTALAAVALSYLAICVYVYAKQDSMVFKPTKELATGLPPGCEQLWLDGKDGVKLSAWLFKAESPKATILFLHGNRWNIAKFTGTAELYRKLGLSCLMVDYRGYGASTGKPSEEGLYADAETAYQWLIGEGKVPEGRIIIAGRSLGGALAARLASRRNCAGLMLESTFTSLDDEGAYFHPFLPIGLISKYRFDTAADLAKVKCPLLAVHSRDDKTVPLSLGRRLFEKGAMKSKTFVELSGSHNDCYFESGSVYADAVAAFVKACVPLD